MSVPYSFSLSDDGSYEFITEAGVKYDVYFRETHSFFEKFPLIQSDVLEFGFSRESKTRNKDPRVASTVIHLLLLFFEKNPNGIVYFVCDSVDKKHSARHILFDKWYSLLNDDTFEKLDFICDLEGKEFYFSLIQKETSDNRNYVKYILEDIQAEVVDKYRSMF